MFKINITIFFFLLNKHWIKYINPENSNPQEKPKLPDQLNNSLAPYPLSLNSNLLSLSIGFAQAHSLAQEVDLTLIVSLDPNLSLPFVKSPRSLSSKSFSFLNFLVRYFALIVDFNLAYPLLGLQILTVKILMGGSNGSIGPLMPIMLTTKFIFDTNGGLDICWVWWYFWIPIFLCLIVEKVQAMLRNK